MARKLAWLRDQLWTLLKDLKASNLQACQACKLKELKPAFGEGATNVDGHNHVEGNFDEALFQSCVTDWCATGGHLPDYHADECELIKECEVRADAVESPFAITHVLPLSCALRQCDLR